MARCDLICIDSHHATPHMSHMEQKYVYSGSQSGVVSFLSISGTQDSLAERIHEGLPIKSMEALRSAIGPKLFEFVLPRSTYQRNKTRSRLLTSQTSDALYRAARVFDAARNMFQGDEEKTKTFLAGKHILLGNRIPIEVAAQTSAGMEEVLRLIGRARAGVAV